MKQVPLILASGSPRRKFLLKQIGLDFQVIPSDIHEDFSLRLPSKDFAEHFAKLKAHSVANQFPNRLVIGADTIVVFNNKILGKPSSKKEGTEMLSRLSGQTHTVITGVCLELKDQKICETFSEETRVTFQHLSENEIQDYIEIYSPLDKAGSYGIQDWFSVCVKKVNGCYYNVVGFPLSAFYQKYKAIISTF
ncbi:MAG TPA: septum formation protein Maf [Candidatus Marinimicrobia bacterium]|nr:septum formation protein Maf [Candidatus Neomarinimicrobiota bacterium]HIB29244.1 septum formation protein Maf [Candidatus Neomarinimicrobiota bacterium]HIB52822.1 septum formation protein Maf [Candidatus Neomarinimicrobiota bacterium]HIN96453.1 septum formation protein Maf [Candidatus Neomarinimicrobiota bacterium]HIO40753.1 septum formation protein Maf [Candidatus Neomarinimicrobiota bacterium]